MASVVSVPIDEHLTLPPLCRSGISSRMKQVIFVNESVPLRATDRTAHLLQLGGAD